MTIVVLDWFHSHLDANRVQISNTGHWEWAQRLSYFVFHIIFASGQRNSSAKSVWSQMVFWPRLTVSFCCLENNRHFSTAIMRRKDLISRYYILSIQLRISLCAMFASEMVLCNGKFSWMVYINVSIQHTAYMSGQRELKRTKVNMKYMRWNVCMGTWRVCMMVLVAVFPFNPSWVKWLCFWGPTFNHIQRKCTNRYYRLYMTNFEN